LEHFFLYTVDFSTCIACTKLLFRAQWCHSAGARKITNLMLRIGHAFDTMSRLLYRSNNCAVEVPVRTIRVGEKQRRTEVARNDVLLESEQILTNWSRE
jgi:hypothetical protein